MARYSEFSFTSLWARIGGKVDQAFVATGHAPRGIVVVLPEAERAALAAQITPHLDALEALRLQTLTTVDKNSLFNAVLSLPDVPMAGSR